jgi:hypothetical protein
MLYSRHQVFRWLLVDNLFLAKAKVTALLLRAKAKKVVSKYSHKYISLVLREYGHGMGGTFPANSLGYHQSRLQVVAWVEPCKNAFAYLFQMLCTERPIKLVQ